MTAVRISRGLQTPRNLPLSSMVISVYASILRELGLPLRFPGTPNAYTALYQVTSADILARATEWATTSPSAANEIFNVTNGDYFRWINLWPALARYFNIPCGDPLPLDAVWKSRAAQLNRARYVVVICSEYGVAKSPRDNLATL